MKSALVLLAVFSSLALGACGSDSKAAPKDTTEADLMDLAADPCRDLSLAECEAAKNVCEPLLAYTAEVACADPDPGATGAQPVFVGCRTLGTEETFCTMVATWGCTVEAPVTCYLFSEWCSWQTFVEGDQEAICNPPQPDPDVQGDLADLEGADSGCQNFGLPGDETHPEDECWNPPANFCSAGANQAVTVACTTDLSLCCVFPNSCVPCGWSTACEFCSVEGGSEDDFEYCGALDAPQCDGVPKPISAMAGSAPSQCPKIVWNVPICLD